MNIGGIIFKFSTRGKGLWLTFFETNKSDSISDIAFNIGQLISTKII